MIRALSVSKELSRARDIDIQRDRRMMFFILQLSGPVGDESTSRISRGEHLTKHFSLYRLRDSTWRYAWRAIIEKRFAGPRNISQFRYRRYYIHASSFVSDEIDRREIGIVHDDHKTRDRAGIDIFFFSQSVLIYFGLAFCVYVLCVCVL